MSVLTPLGRVSIISPVNLPVARRRRLTRFHPLLGLGLLVGVALLFSVIVLGVVISELVGMVVTVRMLRAAGAIDPNVEAALKEGDEARAEAEAMGRH